MSDHIPGAPLLFVRTDASWWRAPTDLRAPERSTLGELRRSIQRCASYPPFVRSGPATAPFVPDPPDELATVAPVWTIVGAVTPTGLLIEGWAGNQGILDDDDLTIIDTLTEPVTLRDVPSILEQVAGLPMQLEDVLERADRLRWLGVLRVVSAAPDAQDETHVDPGSVSGPRPIE